MSDWKELEIGTPIEVLIKNKYEIAKLILNEYRVIPKEDLEDRIKIYEALDDGDSLFYRLKPLEPIRISIELAEAILEHQIPGATFNDCQLIRFRYRKVEIIEE